jgi:hypothetical protein
MEKGLKKLKANTSTSKLPLDQALEKKWIMGINQRWKPQITHRFLCLPNYHCTDHFLAPRL